jgi:hypothetical protein
MFWTTGAMTSTLRRIGPSSSRAMSLKESFWGVVLLACWAGVGAAMYTAGSSWFV